MSQIDQLLHNLTNHAPASDDVIEKIEDIRAYGKALGKKIIQLSPPCREQSLALTNLEQTVMWAVAGIARNQDKLSPLAVDDGNS